MYKKEKWNTEFYLITDSSYDSEEVFLYKIEQALQGGVTLLQLREKERTTREYIELARKVHQIAEKYKVPLVIDDRVDVALAVDAEGAHVGDTDMPVETARRLLGRHKILGVTAKTVKRAREAYEQGADYLGVGAIFPTTTKVRTVLTKVEVLDEICRAVPIPVNAIGGLNANNLEVLRGIPVSGICVVSAVMRAEHPKAAVMELRDQMRKTGIPCI